MRIGLGLALLVFVTGLILPTALPAQSWKEKGTSFLKDVLQGSGRAGGLSNGEMAGGLKDALRVGTHAVVSRLSRNNGFNGDAKIHIPLPRALAKAKKIAATFGLAGELNRLELKMNRAAERATKQSKKLFLDAIRQITFADARKIVNGPENSATLFFRRKMQNPLRKRMRPIVKKALSEVGAVRSFNRFMQQYKSLPLVPKVKTDLVEHVLSKGLDGIFHYVAEEEKAIRRNPAKRTTALLRKVFAK